MAASVTSTTNSYLRPLTIADALEARAAHPDWLVIAGGTDVMVAVNFGRSRPHGVIDLSHVNELKQYDLGAGMLRLGAGVTFGTVERELGGSAPALAMAARGVGSPQLRVTATIGGNLGTASPAGDAAPALIAAGAVVDAASVRGTRSIPIDEFFVRPGVNVLDADELVVAVAFPPGSPGTAQFAKVGTRNAMVIAVASVAVTIDRERRHVGVGLGSVAPTPLRAREAERFLADWLWSNGGGSTSDPANERDITRFGQLVAGVASPIDDVRGTASYRRHVIGLLARRCATRCLEEAS